MSQLGLYSCTYTCLAAVSPGPAITDGASNSLESDLSIRHTKCIPRNLPLLTSTSKLFVPKGETPEKNDSNGSVNKIICVGFSSDQL